MPVSWLKEPHAHKVVFFNAIANADGGGKAMRTWPVSFRSFPQTKAVAEACLARAKRKPKWFLSRWLKLAFLKGRYNYARRYFRKRQEHVALCWQGLTGTRRAFMMGAIDGGADTLFAELSPFKGYRTLDSLGVNAEGSVPKDREFYDDVVVSQCLLDEIKNGMRARPSRRSDVGQAGELPSDIGNFVFVPLQVPDDSQMILFSDWIQSSQGFVDALAAASQSLPEGWHLRLKEHPSSKISLTRQIDKAIKNGAKIEVDNQTDSFEQLEASKAVLTVNSSMGLQAMFFDKPVITTGYAFYSLPGLVTHANSQKTLNDALSRSELLNFDGDFRARFLTWLLTDYYVKEEALGYDKIQLQNRLAEARQ